MQRDDRILGETRLLCWVVVAVLVPAVVVLWGFPGHTEDYWSWPITPDLSQIFMGAGYGAGAYFFARAALASRWHTVSVGVLSAAFFAAVILVVTIVHWDGFNHGDGPFGAVFAFYGWVIVYGAAPFVVGGLWLRNQRTDPRRPEPGEPIVSAGVRLAARTVAVALGATALALLLWPSLGVDYGPWALTPATTRGARRVRRAGGVRCAARLARRALGLVAASPAGVPRRDGAPARRRGAGVGGDRDGPRLGLDLPRRSRRDGPCDPRPLSEDGELGRDDAGSGGWDVTESFDVIVVGAGPAGSTSAYRLAREGLSVLLLDRARFPRDKPCGGGVTGRAAALLPFSIDPVVEDVVDRLEIGLAYTRRFERQSEKPLIYMTRRVMLDAFLVEQACKAGAVFRDGTKVTELELRADEVVVKTKDWAGRCRVVIGADGTNGIAARALGCDAARVHLVALEADLSYEVVERDRYRGRAVLELGAVPGGYGWIFPKGDHVNVGVGGWEAEGPRLRSHLAGLVEGYGLDGGSLENVRGYRLPLRGAGDGLTNGRGLVVGDAAGLVDPLTGDGMYEAFLSARLASRAVIDFLEGSTDDLAAYAEATLRAIGPLSVASWGGKRAFDRFPRVSYSVARTRRAWRVIADLLQDGGEPEPPRTATRCRCSSMRSWRRPPATRPGRTGRSCRLSGRPRGRRLMPGETLRATAGPASGLTLRIDAELQLGRAAPGLERLAADAELSRSHASIRRDDDGALVIEDLGSRNGTWVNGARVERARLEPGDVIRVGESTFELVVVPPASLLYDDELIRPWYEHARECSPRGCRWWTSTGTSASTTPTASRSRPSS